MTTNEFYLKTVFSCIACDGEIAPEEVDMVRKLSQENEELKGIDAESLLNKWINEINAQGGAFLRQYLSEVSEQELNKDQQLEVIDLAIKAIESDNRIEYSEVKFFKKIRFRLPISDEAILAVHPDKEDFLLPDINVIEDPIWDDKTQFELISLNSDFEANVSLNKQ